MLADAGTPTPYLLMHIPFLYSTIDSMWYNALMDYEELMVVNAGSKHHRQVGDAIAYTDDEVQLRLHQIPQGNPVWFKRWELAPAALRASIEDAAPITGRYNAPDRVRDRRELEHMELVTRDGLWKKSYVIAEPFLEPVSMYTRVTWFNPYSGKQESELIPTDFLIAFFEPSSQHTYEETEEFEERRKGFLGGV